MEEWVVKRGLSAFSLLLVMALASCNEEIPGYLTFYPDGGKLFYHTSADDTLKELAPSDYSSATDVSVTFQGIATRRLPDAVKYLSAQKDGYTFLGWKQRKADGSLSNNVQNFEGTASWNYSRAEYQAYYEKNLTLTFIPIVSVETIGNDGNTVNEWREFKEIPPLTLDTYNSFSFTAKDISDFVEELNRRKNEVDFSASSFNYRDHGRFDKIISAIGDSEGLKEIRANENQLTYYVPFEENPSITYTYPEGALDKEGGNPINPLTEKKYTTINTITLDNPALQPSVLEPYLPDARFLGWYSQDGEGKESRISFTSSERVQGLAFNSAHAKFLRKLDVTFDLNNADGTSDWEGFVAPLDMKVYPGETLDLTPLGSPIHKDKYKDFDFWYLDMDENGVYTGDVDLKFENGLLAIPSDIERIRVRPWAKERPILTLDLSGSKAYWDLQKITDLGFEPVDDKENIFKVALDEGRAMNEIFTSLSSAILDAQRFVLHPTDPFLLSEGGKVPSTMDNKGYSIVPNGLMREKVTLHYVTGIGTDGSRTYGQPAEHYFNVGFASSLANYEASAQNVTYPDFHEDPSINFAPNVALNGYYQWGWSTDAAGANPGPDFKVSANQPLTLYAVMKKKIKLTLNYDGTTKEMYGLEGDKIPYVKLMNLFGSSSALVVVDDNNNAVDTFPLADQSYSVLGSTQPTP